MYHMHSSLKFVDLLEILLIMYFKENYLIFKIIHNFKLLMEYGKVKSSQIKHHMLKNSTYFWVTTMRMVSR